MPSPRPSAQVASSKKMRKWRENRHQDDGCILLTTPAEEDVFRLIHSAPLRRLSGITQVVPADLTHSHHHRLIHVLEVAQVGRQLANYLLTKAKGDLSNQINPDVVYAACLAHDLGHPCFGHVAEKELDILAKGTGLEDGFEGNAQSFRIVTRLAVYRGYFEGSGLNLTQATLNAILKYPWLRKPATEGKAHEKWNAYNTEKEIFHWVRKDFNGPKDGRSLEAELMDWADDIAYSIHDLEDFYSAGLIPMGQLAQSEDERDHLIEKAAERASKDGRNFNESDFRGALDFLCFPFKYLDHFDGSNESRTVLSQVTSALLRRYIKAATLKSNGSMKPPTLDIPEGCRQEVAVLKELTWQYVIDAPSLSSQQHGQKEIIGTLFRIYTKAIADENLKLLPLETQEWLSILRERGLDWESERTRIVVDLIAGMTESQAIAMYGRFTGMNLGDPLRSPVR